MISHSLRDGDVLDEIDRSHAFLLEIQRPYVWKRPQAAKATDSLCREYPAASESAPRRARRGASLQLR